uniref:Uncharacterized protein n=1 Tax=Lepeophtheirus salmonis TaxID=72036 RepID=A0A0K2VHD2_LEPSM
MMEKTSPGKQEVGVQFPMFLSSLEKEIKQDTIKSVNRLGNDFSVAARPIRRAVKGDLGLSSSLNGRLFEKILNS